VPPNFAVLHVPATAEEMNKSRRMIALQARAFADLGGVVAVLDPRGTGDSCGEHGGATWTGWREDVGVAWHWLAARAPYRSILWGLRLGGLLALDAMATEGIAPDALLLWQPVASGKQWFSQFLRLATAQQIAGTRRAGFEAKGLRAALAAGRTIEIAGYDIHPELVSGAEVIDLAAIPAPACPTVLREVPLGSPAGLSPVAERVVGRWLAEGAHVDALAIEGPSFWAAQEIAEVPQLIKSTIAAVISVLDGSSGRTLAGS
jgi:exosortase A-associated hydrolase 2